MSEEWIDLGAAYYRPTMGNMWRERIRGKHFDSYFGRSSHHTQNHVLKIYLRVHLERITKQTAAIDADKKAFPVRDWTDKGWAKFRDEFFKQSNLWNNHFWLVPPAHFTLGDAAGGGRTRVRPNIKCSLFVEAVDDPKLAHQKIQVFNIDEEKVKNLDALDDENPRLGKFRSDSHHLDSMDMKTGSRRYEDADGEEYTIKHHYTIAHEIGHALGQPHVGVLKSTAKCELALKFGRTKDKSLMKDPGSLYHGKGNAPVCYGTHDSLALAENIMGLGYKFEEINAQPWQQRLEKHTNVLWNSWRVNLTDIHPLPVPTTRATDHRKWIAG
jgi:hypothetical protein